MERSHDAGRCAIVGVLSLEALLAQFCVAFGGGEGGDGGTMDIGLVEPER